ncbi:MAG: hypothetical protein AB1324_02625 [Candidatus Micrarchaeota archaeon]
MIKRADMKEESGNDSFRVKARNVPVLGAKYEMWATSGGKSFHEAGGFPQIEGLIIKNELPQEAYLLLLGACRQIGDEKSLEFSLGRFEKMCLCSLSLWNQSIAVVSRITGLSEDGARNTMFSLHQAGYITLVQHGDQVRHALTYKGKLAHKLMMDEGEYKRMKVAYAHRAANLDLKGL